MESTLLAGGKSKKDGNLEDSARGQADPGSAAVYTMDRPGPVRELASKIASRPAILAKIPRF